MTRPRPSSLERRQRILESAARQFAEHGYAAASLRDIAQDAGCSLTLLDHHFGDKAHLLQAVVKAQEDLCQQRLAGLKAMLAQPAELDLEKFIAAWAHYEFDLYDTREGKRYLTLMLRLQADREVNDDLRKTLNCSESTVLRGFQRAWPGLDRPALARVWRMASSALYAAVTSIEEVPDAQRPQEAILARRRVIAFLLNGLNGYCGCATDSPPDALQESSNT